MANLSEENKQKIIDALKCEPLSVQEVSKIIGKSWVTTDTYLQRLKETTGLIDIKVFRKGSQGALKVVYYKNPTGRNSDSVKRKLFHQIMGARRKQDFDFMELYQFVPEDKKKTFIETYKSKDESLNQELCTLFKSAKNTLLCFSGNLSFINLKENGVSVVELIEDALKRKVSVKIITRINISSLRNIKKIEHLLQRYEGLFEIRHAYQPLRGFIVDQAVARFKNEEQLSLCKKNELDRNLRIFYEIYDFSWVMWLQDVFWDYYNSAMDCSQRIKEINKVFRHS